MYVPRRYAQTDDQALFRAIREIGVATVVSHGRDGLIATHAPVELDTTAPGDVRLRCHFAKPNPHGGAIAAADELLVIFQGPNAYITPNWYPTKAATAEVVPTWNYAAVHVYGRGEIYDDPVKLRRHLAALTDHFESRGPSPWSLDDAPDEFVARQMRGIVGVEIQVTRIEGKWKMSQNRPAEDREGVIAGLRERSGAQDQAVSDAVELAHRAESVT